MLLNGLIGGEYNEELINPASLDVCLGNEFLVVSNTRPIKSWIDDNSCNLTRLVLGKEGTITLMPSQFVLAHTKEILSMPNDVAAQFQLKSRLGRVGLEHQMAGWIDPGFKGSVTLELFNSAPYPIVLKRGQRIGQLIFHQLDYPLSDDEVYDGHYNNFNTVQSAVVAKDSTV